MTSVQSFAIKTVAGATSGPIVVRSRSRHVSGGHLSGSGLRAPCALGRSGIRARKREGDGATPLGVFRLLRVYYRPDRVQRPRTGLPVIRLRPADGWCDAGADRNYNRPVELPYPASCEQMWRSDDVYDIVVVLSHNTRPRKRGAGSAIFMHIARPGYSPTEGCIALSRRDLLAVLARCGRSTTMRIV